MVVNIGTVTVEDKEYDGTDTATVKDVAFTQPTTRAVYSRRAAAPALNVTSNDYIVTSARFGGVGASSANAGTRGANGTIKLLNQNFAFEDTRDTAVSTFTTTSGEITKAVVTNTTPLIRYLNAGTEYSYPINDLVSGLTGRQDFGNITWDTTPTFVPASGITGSSGDSYTIDRTNGILTVKFGSRDGIADGTFIGTLTLTGAAQNLKTENSDDLILTIDVYLTSKPVAVRNHTLEKDAITYGDPLSKSQFRADTSYLVTNDSHYDNVYGTFSWINPTRVPDAGTRWAEWLFTPGTAGYSTVYGAAQVTVNKAAPTIYSVANDVEVNGSVSRTYDGNPITFTAKHNVYTVGPDATTGEYVLTEVPSRWLWSKDGTSVTAPVDVQSNETYTVTFMPNDTVNYEPVTFTVTVTINPETITPTITAVEREYEPSNTKVALSDGTLTDIADRDTGKVSIDLQNATGEMSDADVGTGKTVNVTGAALIGTAARNYTLSTNITTVNIKQKTLTTDMVTLDYSTRLVYDGTAKTVAFTVKDGDTVLTAGTDYTVTEDTSSGTNAGSHTLKLTGQGNYGGTIDVNWYIEPEPITADTVTGVTLKRGDTTVTVPYSATANFTSADTGTGKAAYVYVTLLDPNYSFEGQLATIAVPCTANIAGSSGGHGTSGGSSSGAGVTSAATGDAGIALYGLLTLSAYTGSALVIRGRKKF